MKIYNNFNYGNKSNLDRNNNYLMHYTILDIFFMYQMILFSLLYTIFIFLIHFTNYFKKIYIICI